MFKGQQPQKKAQKAQKLPPCLGSKPLLESHRQAISVVQLFYVNISGFKVHVMSTKELSDPLKFAVVHSSRMTREKKKERREEIFLGAQAGRRFFYTGPSRRLLALADLGPALLFARGLFLLLSGSAFLGDTAHRPMFLLASSAR